MRKDLAKFGKTVTRRCIEDSFTLSGLHAGLISAKTVSFSSGTVLANQDLKTSEVQAYATHFKFDVKEMQNNWTHLHKFWPYIEGKTTAPSVRLKAGYPSNAFFKYVSAALRSFPLQALTSVRRGSDGHTLGGMFLAAYYAEAVTAKYFDVRGNHC